MGTKVRPVISKANDFYISKEHYYELKHFCQQYKEWHSEYSRLAGEIPDGFKPTEDQAIRMKFLSDKIYIFENALRRVNELIRPFIAIGVTEGRTYEWIRDFMTIPFCRNYYYAEYRKFFYILAQDR